MYPAKPLTSMAGTAFKASVGRLPGTTRDDETFNSGDYGGGAK